VRVLLLASFLAACSGSPDQSGDPVGSDGSGGSGGSGGSDGSGVAIRLQEIAQAESPTFLTAPPGDSRLFVVEQDGRIRVIQNGQLLTAPFLDITDRVGTSSNEQGLLGLAFHPGYAANGYFFVNYTDRSGDTRVERYRVTSDRNRADPASTRRLLTVDQPFANHNGGMLAFGPDGMLYIGLGDGAAATRRGTGRSSACCWGKCCASTSIGGIRTPSLRTTRSSARPAHAARSGLTGSAIPGASPSIGRPAGCTWGTSGRTRTRR
jgi:glucose/arabinose dehydrogenase